ncbi:spore germination protein GerPB [Gorillibacterium massiliense]|uniref:spore germination protein GerPB n=1 Tax=Gorillibacterium massiliense TaxID=1280390 RepID=UPI0004B8D5B7|nr:spore germination protein GerPB [Gorillibacterium massiliense]
MNLTVHQSIVIHQLRVGDVTSASVFQIGAAGSIKSLASTSDTGHFMGGLQRRCRLSSFLLKLHLEVAVAVEGLAGRNCW